MGPTSKQALNIRWEAEERYFGALLEELIAIRSSLNTLTGRTALEQEGINERLDRTEERLFQLERARPTRPDA